MDCAKYNLSSEEQARYVQNQIAHNLQRLSIEGTGFLGPMFLSYLLDRLSDRPILRGVAHGCRQGWEPFIFGTMLGSYFVGTDISPTCNFFPHMLERDFHELVEHEVGYYDLVFSNAWDQSNDPSQALGNWLKSIADGGFMVLRAMEPGTEFVDGKPSLSVNETDPFSGTLVGLKSYLEKHCAEDLGGLQFYIAMESDWQGIKDGIQHPYGYLIVHKSGTRITDKEFMETEDAANRFCADSPFPRSIRNPNVDLTNTIAGYKSVCLLISFALSYPDFTAVNCIKNMRHLLSELLPGYDHAVVSSQVEWNGVFPELQIKDAQARTVSELSYHATIINSLERSQKNDAIMHIF